MSISVQLQTVLAMFTCGALMGMGFDTYHVFKARTNMPAWMVFLFDLLFWVGSMGMVFWILVKVNDGTIRFPVFFGMLLGAWLYFVLGSKKYIHFLHRMIKFSQWLYRTVLLVLDTLIVRPILFLYRVILTLLLFIWSVLRAVLGFLWKVMRLLASPFARWGQHFVKKLTGTATGFWQRGKKWFFAKKKRE